jgi:hypothetical protein
VTDLFLYPSLDHPDYRPAVASLPTSLGSAKYSHGKKKLG